MTGVHQAVAGGRVLSVPSIVGTTSVTSQTADFYEIPLPSGVQANRILWGAVAGRSGFALGAPISPSGITTLQFTAADPTSPLRLLLFYKVLAGTESGNIYGDLPGSQFAYCGFASIIGDVDGDAGTLAETASNASSITPDPLAAPWGGTNPSLYISFLAWRGSPAPDLSAYPDSYTIMQTTVPLTNLKLAVAARRIVTTNEVPGPWTLSSNAAELITVISRFKGV